MAMVRSAAVLLIFLVLSASFLANAEGSSSRKLLISSSSAGDNKVAGSSNSCCSWLKSTFLGAPSKGRVPNSAPSNKGHATTLDNENLFQRHLARIDRILQSVPSPGMGH